MFHFADKVRPEISHYWLNDPITTGMTMKNTLLPLLGFILLTPPLAATAQQFGDFTYSTDGAAITIIGYTGLGGEVTIPDTIADLPVTTISAGAFLYAGSMTSLTFPNSVTNINLPGLFQNCSNLLAFIVPPANPSYASVDGVLFNHSQTTLLRYPGAKAGHYLIPGSVTNIEDYAFQNCREVAEVIIPDGVTRIGTYAFVRCASLTNAAIPSSVTSLGSFAFNGCPRLGKVTIPGSIQYVRDGAFGSCTNLTSLAIGNGVISFWPGAFADCTSLASVTLPDSLLSIGSYAFLRCTSLTNVTIPGSVTTIGPNAFSVCSNLTSVTIAHGVKNIGDNAYDYCFRLPRITIPGSVTNIGNQAFWNCTNLSSVSISEGVRSFGLGAFMNCSSLTNITIPASVTTLQPQIFLNCPELRGIFFKGNRTAGFSSGFVINSTPTLYYLPGATGWGTTFGGRPVLLWNPLMAASDPSFGVGPGGFSFTITGTTNIPIVVEAATNLSEADWVALQSLNLNNGTHYFSDPEWTDHAARLYRIRSP